MYTTPNGKVKVENFSKTMNLLRRQLVPFWNILFIRSRYIFSGKIYLNEGVFMIMFLSGFNTGDFQ